MSREARVFSKAAEHSHQVISPFQAILDYERSKNIPPGWVNHCISATSPNGSWQRIERGEIPLDAAFFAEFKRDLTDEKRWRAFYTKHLARQRKENASDEAAYSIPPTPDIDAEWLYWEMMRVARQPDPHMFPALQKLRAAADASKGQLVLAAMSNTSHFPEGHAFNDVSTPEGKQNAELKGLFDVFVSSAHVGMRKPAEDIYFYTLGRVAEFVRQKGWSEEGVRMEDVVFLDDIGGNLKTGRKVGMATVKVVLGKTEDAVQELEKITGLSLADEKARL